MRSFVSKSALLLMWARTGVLPPTISLEGDVMHTLFHTRGDFWRQGFDSGPKGRKAHDHGWVPCVYAVPSVDARCFPCLQAPSGFAGPGKHDRCMDETFVRAVYGAPPGGPASCVDGAGQACPTTSEKPLARLRRRRLSIMEPTWRLARPMGHSKVKSQGDEDDEDDEDDRPSQSGKVKVKRQDDEEDRPRRGGKMKAKWQQVGEVLPRTV